MYTNHNGTAFAVNAPIDVPIVRRNIIHLAQELGFKQTATAQIGIVVTELATNLVAHQCQDSLIWASTIKSATDTGLEIVSCDQGPGIASIKNALQDHHSTAGSIGGGLGTVQRMMDEFDIHSICNTSQHKSTPTHSPVGGTIILARKWLSGNPPVTHWQYGAASRPLPGLTANGDAFHIADLEDGPLIMVVDGLGHGPDAEVASQTVLEQVKIYQQEPFDHLFQRLHQALLSTRGVALTAVKINTSRNTFLHAAIGNVEVKVYPSLPKTPWPQPGVLGRGQLPRLRLREYQYPKNSTLIFHSDGISSRYWNLQRNPELLKYHPATISHYLLREFARPNDDATVVVIKEKPHG